MTIANIKSELNSAFNLILETFEPQHLNEKERETLASVIDVLNSAQTHIDTQAARIASTDAMLTEAVEALRLSEKELAALRNDVSTWETMRKANGLPDTIGATILLAASLRQEMAALRAKVKPAESYSDDADLSFQIDWYDDERNDGIQIAMWLKELRRRRELAAPVAVPDEKAADSSNGDDISAWYDEGWNACRAEVLRLNSGSKPFVVKLPYACQPIMNGDKPYMFFNRDGKWLDKSLEIEAIKAAGGTVSDD